MTAEKPLPQDPDEYEGVPLNLGSAHPAPTRDRPRDAEVARVLAKAIAEEEEGVRQAILDYLDQCARAPDLPDQARAAGVATGLIRELLGAQGAVRPI